MSDYISREAVEQVISAQCGECADTCLEFDGIQPDCNQCLLGGAAKAIKRIPAADVVPVRHGEWAQHYVGQERTPWGSDCSVCGEWLVIDRLVMQEKYHYCPNCGADMREANDEKA